MGIAEDGPLANAKVGVMSHPKIAYGVPEVAEISVSPRRYYKRTIPELAV